ncbi:MlrC domain-containing protein [Agrobacterium sp. TS43]|uniref:M81 family metallopeptidase n=1 Tax=Agrobacterium TaxID=357 RepID=UPI0003625E48|nr:MULTISPECIES: M81 family metallopeptidase [Agrobacterium]EPR23092.1 MlrC domain-containing protein [Agrobacterium radiobacter DSM 30147]KDR86887.1 microcystin degradation protein MlrC [Agrobacterium tumefaciens GW4]KVK42460.1 MlrC domain-containing protein [Agrobacterium sp. LY4]KVK42792.1 MlrC domain-containing protein [Agrobacterium sp. JL28]KVK57037.1 MlrC domain-containing protein [Agrobacterium sp. TS45]
MRIAVGGIHTECSTYSPVLMGEQDFRVFRGAELLEAEYFNFLGGGGADVLPLLHARAVPGGPVSRAAYEAFKAEFLERLKACLPLDGLYLAMHGAMNVEGMDDAEGDWISSARAVVGPDVVVSASYDLHGNVSQTIIDQLDIFAGYRTAPHIDVRETMVRAWTMLLKALKTGEKPGVAWAKIPVLLPGEKTSTEDEPTKSLYAVLPDHDARPGIWDANFMIGYVWADEPRATACAVVTGTDKAAAQAVATEIAQSYWDARQDFRFGPVTEPLEAILDIAENTATRPIILADSGDNPTGGGVGDRADVLVALIARNWQGALLGGITDRPAVEACFAAGEGAALSLKIGGSLDPQSPSVTVEARVVKLDDPGAADQRQAVVAIGGITVILAARRRPYHMISDFTRLGFNPKEVRLLVVKSGYLSPELAPIANPNLMALTEGVINQDIENLSNRRRDGDFYPWKPHFDYTPQPILSARWR